MVVGYGGDVFVAVYILVFVGLSMTKIFIPVFY